MYNIKNKISYTSINKILWRYIKVLFFWFSIFFIFAFMVATYEGVGPGSYIIVVIICFIGLLVGVGHCIILAFVNKSLFQIMFILTTFIGLLSFLYLEQKKGLLNGYHYINYYNSDDIYLSKDNQIVVKPMIIDIQVIGHLIIGLRLPNQKIKCNDEHYFGHIENKNVYFILDTTSGTLVEYYLKNIFEEILKKKGFLKDDIQLNYSKFMFLSNKVNCNRYDR